MNTVKQISIASLAALTVLMTCGPDTQAQDAQQPTRPQALAFVKEGLNGRKEIAFYGATPSGKPCALFLTDRTFDNSEDYYVVVGYPGASDMNDYVGVVASQAAAARSGNRVTFWVGRPWGNDSKFNDVQVHLDGQGKPIRALGISDLRDIDCQLK